MHGENACMFVCGMYKRGVCVYMCSMCVVCTCVWYMSHDIVCGKGERGTFLLQTQRAAVIEWKQTSFSCQQNS